MGWKNQFKLAVRTTDLKGVGTYEEDSNGSDDVFIICRSSQRVRD